MTAQCCPDPVPAMSRYIFIFSGTNNAIVFNALRCFFLMSRRPGLEFAAWLTVCLFFLSGFGLSEHPFVRLFVRKLFGHWLAI